MLLVIPEPQMEVMTGEPDQPEDAGEQEPQETEGQRLKRLKREKEAKAKKQTTIILAASIGALVLLGVFFMVFRGGGGDERNERRTTTDNDLPDALKAPSSGQQTSGKQAQAQPETPISDLPPPPAEDDKDPVERFIRWAVQTKDADLKAHAMMFKPADPRLQFESKWRQPPPSIRANFKPKISVLASILDVEYGPPPSAATDQIEARMLMDKDLVGNFMCSGAPGKVSMIFVFLSPCSITMADVVKKYGPPANEPMASSGAKIYFYGRMALVEAEGKLHAVTRRKPGE
jgi:hypothetical protein